MKNFELTLTEYKKYWRETLDKTETLPPSSLTKNEIVTKANEIDPTLNLTKRKIEYFQKKELIYPSKVGSGKERTSWRYDRHILRLVIFFETLKEKYNLQPKDLQRWVSNHPIPRNQNIDIAFKNEKKTVPAPANLTYGLVQNRVLATFISTLLKQNIEKLPNETIFAIRRVDLEKPQNNLNLLESQEIKQHLDNNGWFFAAFNERKKLFIYNSFEEVTTRRSQFRLDLEKLGWLNWIYPNSHDQDGYELCVGMRKSEWERIKVLLPETTLPLNPQGLHATILENNLDSLGISILLTAAFGEEIVEGRGTEFGDLIDIIEYALQKYISYAAILIPLENDPSKLIISVSGTNFPDYLADKLISTEKFLSGQSFSQNIPIFIENISSSDPRIEYFREEQPAAAAAIPLSTQGTKGIERLGVLYLASKKPKKEEFGPEFREAVNFFALICRDRIVRDEIEKDTVHDALSLTLSEKMKFDFETIKDGIEYVIDNFDNTYFEESLTGKWVHFITIYREIVSISHFPNQKNLEVIDWVSDVVVKMVTEFLYELILDTVPEENLDVWVCRHAEHGFVFGFSDSTNLSEEIIKEKVQELKARLNQLKLDGYLMNFTPWCVPIQTNHFKSRLQKIGRIDTVSSQISTIEVAMEMSPKMVQGHEAMAANNLDDAATHFFSALRNLDDDDGTAYMRKHLAEVRFRQSKYEEAIKQVNKALDLDNYYVSAKLILAESYLALHDYKPAFKAFEAVLGRAFFETPVKQIIYLYRCGLAYSTLPAERFRSLKKWLKDEHAFEHRLHNGKFTSTPLNPHQEAIALYELARDIEINLIKEKGLNDHQFVLEKQKVQARFYLRSGYAYIQSATHRSESKKMTYFDYAEEQFELSRRHDHNNPQIFLAFAHLNALRQSENRLKHKKTNE